MSAYADTVTVLRAAVVRDSYTGNETRDWTAATERTVPAVVQPLRAEEYTGRRQTTVTYYRVFLDPFDVLATDQVRWSGDVYDIDGEPEQHPHRGRLHHIEAVLKRVD